MNTLKLLIYIIFFLRFIYVTNSASVFQREKFSRHFTKFDDEFLRTLVDKENLSEIIIPQLRRECWLRITAQYNEEQGTDFTKAQVVNRYKNSNYQSQLRSEKSKSQDNNTYQNPEEMTINVKTEVVEDNFEIVPTEHDEIGKEHALKRYEQFAAFGDMPDQMLNQSSISRNFCYENNAKFNAEKLKSNELTTSNIDNFSKTNHGTPKLPDQILPQLFCYKNNADENLKSNALTPSNIDKIAKTNHGTPKFNDENLLRLCEENNLSQNLQPLLRKQCWVNITAQYNQLHGTNFEKIQVVNRYQNYQSWLKKKSLYCQKTCKNLENHMDKCPNKKKRKFCNSCGYSHSIEDSCKNRILKSVKFHKTAVNFLKYPEIRIFKLT